MPTVVKKPAPDDKRTTILEAAVELFAKDGADGFTLRKIADASGFQLGSLYHFFPEKEKLYEQAVTFAFQRCTDLLVEAVTRVPTNMAPAARMEKFITVFYALFTSDSPYIRLIDREHLASGSGHVSELVKTVFWQSHQALNPLVAELSGGTPLAERELNWRTSFIFSLIYGAAKLHSQHTGMLGLDSAKKQQKFIRELTGFAIRAICSGHEAI
jgi:AcrR family transcriptional regulator